MKKLFLLLITVGLLSACASTPPVRKIKLDANAMKFQTTSIEVVAGQPIELTFRNNDVVDHDFAIMEIPVANLTSESKPVAGHDAGHGEGDEPELHMAVLMGESGTLNFTPTKPGTYEFYCTVAGHKEAGMVGTLVVKAP